MLAVDNTLLTLLFNPSAKAPADPNTGAPIERLDERLALLEKGWKDDKEKIIIPAPALAEFLVILKEDGPKYLEAIHRSGNFEIKDFDEMAAVELGARYYEAFVEESKGGQKRLDAVPTKSKVKFDKQIVAIAQVQGARAIYSDDQDIFNYAKQYGITVIRTWELEAPPLPELNPQKGLFDWLNVRDEEQQSNEENNERETAEPGSVDGGGGSESVAPNEARADEQGTANGDQRAAQTGNEEEESGSPPEAIDETKAAS